MPSAPQLLASDFGSPHGVTAQNHWTRELWHITFWFALPIAAIVVGGVVWCLIRYRVRPGRERRPSQFQYHIPIEAAYTIVPLVIVAIVFGFMFNAENKVDAVSKSPAVKITVEGFQWGWRFTYPNHHQEVGTVSRALDINSTKNLPILYMPANETVQLHLVSDDVVHTFYVKEFLLNRDLIPGVNNTLDVNVRKTGDFLGVCNNICGQYHSYMHFIVRVLSENDYNAWYKQQAPNSITNAGA